MRILSLDVGGTAIKSALFHNGSIIQSNEIPSNGSLGRDIVIQNIHNCIALYNNFDVIGLSTTGQVDSHNGIIIGACENIPNYAETDLKRIFEAAYHVPVFVENDVNAAALGELYFGSCTNESDFLCLTYGTGIGGAIILNRSIFKGSLGLAGEIGHIPTHPEGHLCNCGQKGCYETYASTTALIRKVSAYYPELTDGKSIFKRAADNDNNINEHIDEWINEIVYGLVSITLILNPSCIVLGGGVMSQAHLLPKIQSQLHKQVLKCFRNVTLKAATLGNNAGIYGMVAIISNQLPNTK